MMRYRLFSLLVQAWPGVEKHLRDRTNRDLVLVLGGQVTRLGLGIVSSALLARQLGPDGLGVFSVITAVIAIAITLGDFGLAKSAVRHIVPDLIDRPATAQHIARVFSHLRLSGAILVSLLVLALGGIVASQLLAGAEMVRPLVWLAALGTLTASISSIPPTILQALKRFPAVVVLQTVTGLLTLLLIGLLFLAGRLNIISALVVGALTAAIITLVGYGLLPSNWRRTILPPVSLTDPVAQQLWRFGKWLWVSALLAVLLAKLDLLMVNRWVNTTEAGYYALALNLAVKLEIMNQTLYVVLLPAASALTSRGQMRAYLGESMRRSLGFLALLGAAALLARPFILLVYGPAFEPSVGLFYLLLAVVVFDLLSLPALLLAYPLDAPRMIAAYHLVMVVAMIAVGVLLIPGWGGTGAALAKLLAKVLGIIFLAVALTIRWRRNPNAPAIG
jgi:O-antigen/teichoic acid export membrane protein